MEHNRRIRDYRFTVYIFCVHTLREIPQKRMRSRSACLSVCTSISDSVIIIIFLLSGLLRMLLHLGSVSSILWPS